METMPAINSGAGHAPISLSATCAVERRFPAQAGQSIEQLATAWVCVPYVARGEHRHPAADVAPRVE